MERNGTGQVVSNVLLLVLGAFIARVTYNTILKNKKANDKEVFLVLSLSLLANFLLPKQLTRFRGVTEGLFATFFIDWVAAILQGQVGVSPPTSSQQSSFASLMQPPFLNVSENLYVQDLYVNDLYVQENLAMLSSLEAETEKEFTEANKTSKLNVNNLTIL
jgi:xanthine/uracil permease